MADLVAVDRVARERVDERRVAPGQRHHRRQHCRAAQRHLRCLRGLRRKHTGGRTLFFSKFSGRPPTVDVGPRCQPASRFAVRVAAGCAALQLTPRPRAQVRVLAGAAGGGQSDFDKSVPLRDKENDDGMK